LEKIIPAHVQLTWDGSNPACDASLARNGSWDWVVVSDEIKKELLPLRRFRG